jgi:ubiquinone/menaquinone biosynthesis C-methylase UbiE
MIRTLTNSFRQKFSSKMEHTAAVDLIKNGVQESGAQRWADLGAGEGTFTNALASLLDTGSNIYAVDKSKAALQNISGTVKNVTIEKIAQDFSAPLPFAGLDGILMANALHYVREKELFLAEIKKKLKQDGRMVIVEYDTLKANQWIPYPIDFVSLQILMKKIGFRNVSRIAEHPSVYRTEKMYSALIEM